MVHVMRGKLCAHDVSALFLQIECRPDNGLCSALCGGVSLTIRQQKQSRPRRPGTYYSCASRPDCRRCCALVRALIMSPCLVMCQLCQRALLYGSYYYCASPALLVQYQWRESAMTPGRARGRRRGGKGFISRSLIPSYIPHTTSHHVQARLARVVLKD